MWILKMFFLLIKNNLFRNGGKTMPEKKQWTPIVSAIQTVTVEDHPEIEGTV